MRPFSRDVHALIDAILRRTWSFSLTRDGECSAAHGYNLESQRDERRPFSAAVEKNSPSSRWLSCELTIRDGRRQTLGTVRKLLRQSRLMLPSSWRRAIPQEDESTVECEFHFSQGRRDVPLPTRLPLRSRHHIL